MSGQDQVRGRRHEGDPAEPIDPPAPAAAQGSAASFDVDDLLDEIDGVLESNAEEFVRSFVQKGGQ